MRSSCPICTELFDEDSQIAAVMCGHTFHEHCLQHWLTMQNHKRTCPQCRQTVGKNQVIHKLYFNRAEPEEEDPNKLQNMVDTLKATVRQNEQERNRLVAIQEKLQEELEEIQVEKKTLLKDLREQQTLVHSFKQQMAALEHWRDEAERCQEESRKVRRQLQGMLAVESLVKGCEADVQSLVGEHDGDARQLGTWCVILKKELSAKKQECRNLRNEADTSRRELHICSRHLDEKEKQLEIVKECLSNKEEDLKHAEHEVCSLKKKIERLKSNSMQEAPAIIERLVDESPAPFSRTLKRPRLSSPTGGEVDLDSESLNISQDLFSPPSVKKQSESAKEGAIKPDILRTTSAVRITTKPVRNMHDISNIPGLSNMNLFKKKGFGTGQPSALRKGFDGLGGHTLFAESKIKPGTASSSKRTLKTAPTRKPTSKPGKMPPLPTLQSFIKID